MIHETACIDADARLADDVEVGPYAVIGPQVSIGPKTHIGSFAVIHGPTEIGADNRIFPFTSIGMDPQDKKHRPDDPSGLRIGDGNVIREYCSINRGSAANEYTEIGSHNWIMANVHIAHDCVVGDYNVFSNHVTMSGHVEIGSCVTLSGFVGVAQFCRLGDYMFAAATAAIDRNVPPYISVSGNRAKAICVNERGLLRHDFTAERVNLIKEAYRCLYRKELKLKDALVRLEAMSDTHGDISRLRDFFSRTHPRISFISSSASSV